MAFREYDNFMPGNFILLDSVPNNLLTGTIAINVGSVPGIESFQNLVINGVWATQFSECILPLS